MNAMKIYLLSQVMDYDLFPDRNGLDERVVHTSTTAHLTLYGAMKYFAEQIKSNVDDANCGDFSEHGIQMPEIVWTPHSVERLPGTTMAVTTQVAAPDIHYVMIREVDLLQ
jgi:hypothetical protein